MKRILITLDYNPSAQKVAELGNELGKAMKLEIVLLHIIEDVTYYSSVAYSPIMGFGGYINTDFLSNDMMDDVTKDSKHYLEKIKLHLKNKNIITKVVSGKTSDSILKTAKDIKADIVVMGTHGRKGIDEIIMGSTAHKLLKTSKIPLFIIPNKRN